VVPELAELAGAEAVEIVMLIEPHAARCKAAVPVEYGLLPQPGAAVGMDGEIIKWIVSLRRPRRVVVEATAHREVIQPNLLRQAARLVDLPFVMGEDKV